MNAALNIEEIAKAAHGEGSYRLNSSYMLKEQVDWHSEAGSEYYNNPDLEKAKELIEEAGYEDETIRILTTRDYPYLYNASVVIQEQLRSIGFKAELAIYEWATVVEKREDPGEWEIFVTSSPQVPTPVNMSIFNPDWFPGPLDEKTEGLLQAINITTSQEKISALWDELQEYSWETVPIIKIADIAILSAASTKVEGLTNLDGLILWNVKVKK